MTAIIRIKDDNMVYAYHKHPENLTDKQKQGAIEVNGIPEPDRDPSLWRAQLYYDTEKQSLYYKYTERPQDEETM